MPKIVDHEQRRAELAAALWRVVGRAGMAGATVRTVAEEAGWSMGALRHYFATQDELLQFAIDTLLQRVPARVQAHLAADLAPPERARRLLLELVPWTEELRIEAVVWLATLERARTDAALDEVRLAAWAGERGICRMAVALLAGTPLPTSLGEALPSEALEQEAEDLHFFVDGLTLQGASWPEHLFPATLLAITDRRLAGVAARVGPRA